MSFNIEIAGNTSARLLTAGKYCDRDIVVTAIDDGIKLPELNDPGSAEDLVYGKEMIDGDGNVVTGTLPLLPAGNRAFIGLAEEASRIDYAQYSVVRATAPILFRLAMDAESSAQVDIPFLRLPGAEPNLLAENIRKGVSIFDVAGTFEGSGGVDVTIDGETLVINGAVSIENDTLIL
jgi:hypothetical protein